ncbi:DUF2730 family protein [Candidatus Vondammii sp. HM_W22]|uniref:DUF2730 family protein n=1 Tax=Candidatus Vondammii sp. HM_W22 TaxID=2687299 RepID=UPI001F13A8AF|nr:DUF2730 family protein [Candidatus Vondammii sp. HM_W22]
MKIDYSAWRFWYEIALGGVVVVNFAYTWVANRSKANRKAIEGVDERMTETIRRTDRLEQRADNAPSHNDLAVLHDRITDLSGAVRELTGVLQAMRRSVDRVETYLLERE